MRILLVEDDVDLSRQLKGALSDAGYAVDHAADGEEAHFLGDTEPYDVVVLDLGLPKIDGGIASVSIPTFIESIIFDAMDMTAGSVAI